MNDNPWYIVLGAILAIVGGAANNEFSAWRERSRKRGAIIVSLADELREIEATITTMHSVWTSTKIFPPSYIADLLAGTAAYDNLRPELYLLKSADLRKDINDFYKKLKDAARNTDGKLGSLAGTDEAVQEQAGFDAEFQTIAGEAKNMRQKLEGK